MEYCKGGEIFDKLLECKRFRDLDAANLCREMLSAIDYIHERRVVHRDIKAENFIFVTPDISSGVKMIDFGMAATLDPVQEGSDLGGSLQKSKAQS